MKNIPFLIGTIAALAVATPAVAASADYYLVIDGVDGEASTAAKVSNWSFGASNPATVSSGASGRSENPLYVPSGNEHTNPLAETQHTVKSPRDAASGLATGRKSGELMAGDFNRDGVVDFGEAAQVDQLGALNLTVPAGSDAASTLCGKTDHLRSGHIIRSDGVVYDLGTIRTTCMGSDGGATRLALTGSMKQTKTGHVTLMK